VRQRSLQLTLRRLEGLYLGVAFTDTRGKVGVRQFTVFKRPIKPLALLVRDYEFMLDAAKPFLQLDQFAALPFSHVSSPL
jgi:hypothetical protein